MAEETNEKTEVPAAKKTTTKETPPAPEASVRGFTLEDVYAKFVAAKNLALDKGPVILDRIADVAQQVADACRSAEEYLKSYKELSKTSAAANEPFLVKLEQLKEECEGAAPAVTLGPKNRSGLSGGSFGPSSGGRKGQKFAGGRGPSYASRKKAGLASVPDSPLVQQILLQLLSQALAKFLERFGK